MTKGWLINELVLRGSIMPRRQMWKLLKKELEEMLEVIG